jgi:hypothetical protein
MADMARVSDRIRVVYVAFWAGAQVVSAPMTSNLMGPASDQGPISDANRSAVTPAGYAFAIWALIYAASFALAIYQSLPSQHPRRIHRKTGWWVGSAFACSAIWVPLFGTRIIWLSQVVIIMLVVCLALAAHKFTRLGPAPTAAERYLYRLPVTAYLGWATFATFAGFGAMFRSWGMDERSRQTAEVGVVLVVAATIVALFAVGQLSAVLGFVLTGLWALVAVLVNTYVDSVRLAAILAIVILLCVLFGRTVRSRDRQTVLLG